MRPTIEQVIFEMLTENTGSHMLDSGGAYGRQWQRNSKLKLADFKKRPQDTLEICRKYGSDEFSPTVDVFHKLTSTLDLDDRCHEFNRMVVPDWESEEFYGVSADGEAWLKERFNVEDAEESFNTYNWSSNLSQVLQGRFIKCRETDESYLILQVHGGCDVRGGYTDAKLFKVDDDETHRVLSDDCMFPHIDWMGEWINHEGQPAQDEDFKKLIKEFKVRKGTSKIIEGGICE